MLPKTLPRSFARTALFLLLYCSSAAMIVVDHVYSAERPYRGDPPIFEAATRLLADKSDENWREVLGLAAALRDETLQRAEHSPLEKPADLASPEKLAKLPLAAPGLHSHLHSARYLSTLPPGPGSSYLHTAAVVIHGDLVAKQHPLLKNNRRQVSHSWDGYMHGCVLIVDGQIDTNSYIFNSIVIAKGPIRVGGYIYNSLVFSLGTEGESLIDVGGYLHSALVVADDLNVPGYVFQTIVYGKLRATDLRGADLRKPNAMLRLPWELEQPRDLDAK
jgi:hypothetical protein